MQIDVLYADPPWKHNDRRQVRKDGGKPRFGVGAENKYATMETAAIKAIPVANVAALPSVGFIWGTYPMTQDCLDVMAAWKFPMSTIGFNWIKLNRGRALFPPVSRTSADNLTNALIQLRLFGFLDWLTFFGVGHYSKSNPEPCWLGVRGKPVLATVSDEISNVVYAPLGGHSEKPKEVADRIVRMFGPERVYLELFAREVSEGSGLPGWLATGFEYDGLEVTEALTGLKALDLEWTWCNYRTLLMREPSKAVRVGDVISGSYP